MKSASLLIGLGILGAGLAATLMAGDLNPPAGPVAPTMKTNQEIFDAVSGLGGGACSTCEKSIPGAVRGLGTLSITGLPGTGGSTVSDILSMDYKVEHITGTGGGGGSLLQTTFSVTRVIDGASHRFFRACTSQTPIMQATIRLTTNGTSVYYFYSLGDVRIRSIKPTMVQRCDGSFVHAEVVELTSRTVRFTDNVGSQHWEWNFDTNSGSGS